MHQKFLWLDTSTVALMYCGRPLAPTTLPWAALSLPLSCSGFLTRYDVSSPCSGGATASRCFTIKLFSSIRPDQPHNIRMHCEIVDNHGEPLLMNNQELYSVMVQINWTLKTQALTNMQVQWRPQSAGKWHPFQWEAILHYPTAEGHRAVPSSVSRTGDCMHVWLAGRADLLRLFQRTLFRQAGPVSGDAVRLLYTLLSTPPCERQYA